MNVLVVAPHPDDEAIGCGGTLCLHAQRGDRVAVAFLSSGELGLRTLPAAEACRIREAEAEAAAIVLGIASLSFLRQPDWYVGGHVATAAAALRDVVAREEPKVIYLPHEAEWHPDHRAALPIVRAALDGLNVVSPTLRTYEVWTPMAEHEHVEDISAVLDRKLIAIGRHASQLSQLAYDRAITGLNQYRGVIAGGCAYAEVFGHAAVTPTAPGAPRS